MPKNIEIVGIALGYSLVIQETPQLPAPRGMLQLPERLRFDLPDAFARYAELLADFFQRVVGVHADAEAHAQYALLTWRQRSKHPRCRLAQIRLDRRVDGQHRALVLDEITEM